MKKRNNVELMNSELVDYWEKLTPKERKWLRRFNNENHNGLVSKNPEDNQILKDPEHIDEAMRNHSVQTNGSEPYDLAMKGELVIDDTVVDGEVFMEDASDEWEWRDGWKIGGYELARKVILHQTISHLKNHDEGPIWETILNQMYSKMEELRKVRHNEWRKRKKK